MINHFAMTKVTEEEGIYFSLKLLSCMNISQGRNSRQKPGSRNWSPVHERTLFTGWLGLLSYTPRITCPGTVPPTMAGPSPLGQFMESFSQLSSLFLAMSRIVSTWQKQPRQPSILKSHSPTAVLPNFNDLFLFYVHRYFLCMYE